MKRPLFWIGFTFLSAMAVFLTFPPVAAALLSVFVAIAATFLCASKFKAKRLAVLLCAALLGGVWQSGLEAFESHRLAAVKVDSHEVVLINATVTENVVYSGWQSIDVRADVYTSALGNCVTDDITLYGVFSSDLIAGNSISCTAKYNNGRYTVESYNISDEIFHLPLAARLKAQKAVSDKLGALFSFKAAGIIKALLAGDRSGLDDDTVSDFRKSSLSHILVVSGMHLVIISHSVDVILLRFLSKNSCCIAILLFCWAFAALSGFGVSIVRAAVMLTVMQAGQLIGRRSDTLTSLVIAAAVISLPSPEVLISASFLLSFSAVAGLALLQKPISSTVCYESSGSVVKYIAESGSAAAAAQLGTAPVCAVMFGSIPLLGMLSNLAAVWLLQPIMLLGIISIIAAMFHPILAVPFVFICEKLVFILTLIAKLFAAIPFSQLLFNERWQFVWLLGAAVMLAVLHCRLGFNGNGRFAAFAILTVYTAGSLFSFICGYNQADVLLFERSGCVSVAKGGHAILLGAPKDRWQRYDIESAFDFIGVEKLDAVILQSADDTGYHLAKLVQNYRCEAVICQNDRSAQSFCNGIGADLYDYPKDAALFKSAALTASEDGIEVIFKDSKLLKNQNSCDIIGMYTLALPADGAKRIRINL